MHWKPFVLMPSSFFSQLLSAVPPALQDLLIRQVGGKEGGAGLFLILTI